ncbi:metalloregulator ArsR/SmtB family transcription factor [Gemmatimonas sp.]|uniref:ArsR/SmtB family transcription factor n=1 Tax=Gemmatimonas sp. TaxID=1962908 RepID=UPI00286E3BAB|nr:metalloregulator ArsR/SmtB family transcription factor [Gemmatimonas sp.]
MLERNACVVLGNVGTDEDLAVLEAMLAPEHEIVRVQVRRAVDDRCLTHQDSLVYSTLVLTPTTPDLTAVARLFHALSDETRLGILHLLQDGERCVCDLQDVLDAAQSRLSFHLKVLREAGLVTDRKEGRWSYYTIVPEALAIAHDVVVDMRPVASGSRPRLPANARCCG